MCNWRITEAIGATAAILVTVPAMAVAITAIPATGRARAGMTALIRRLPFIPHRSPHKRLRRHRRRRRQSRLAINERLLRF